MEQGANDNASGCAVILESLRVLKQAAGALPAARRGVRGLLVNECYGTIGFAATNPGILRRIVAGVNWDTLGRHGEETGAHFRHHRCPDSAPSVADTLLLELLETWLPKQLPYARIDLDLPWALTDNVYADPRLGVPCPFVLSTDDCWHTSRDVLETLKPRTLHAFATISAAYLAYLAAASGPEARRLALETQRRHARRIEDQAGQYATRLDALGSPGEKQAHLAHAFDHLDYMKDVTDAAVMSAKKLMLREERAAGHKDLLKVNRHTRRLVELAKRRLKELAGCEPAPRLADERLGDLAQRRPLRTFIGTPTYDGIPRPARHAVGSPTWNAHLHGALFWSDGKRTFAEVVRRANHEYGRDRTEMLVKHFRHMAEHGLIKWGSEDL
ncbi:MAG: M28 family peptidase [Planctomycetota bacterium]|nr:M28 family peptidase [Planctomycetota bacterium]